MMLIALTACDQSANQKETKTMTPQPFVCALAKDHNPPLDPEADKYFQEAIALEKPMARKIGLKLLASMKKPLR